MMKKLSLKLDVAYDNLQKSVQAAYESLKDTILRHQEPDGFIMTDLEGCDILWAMVYTGYECDYTEYTVKAVRVKNDDIQIVYDHSNVVYNTDYIAGLDENDPDEWVYLRYDDLVVYLPTLFSLVEKLDQYIDA